MQMINAITLTLTADGSGAATASTQPLQGLLYSVHVKPTAAGWDAGTDITITESGGPGRTLLTLTDKDDTAAEYPVRENGTDGGTTAPLALDASTLTLTMAQAGAGSVCTFYVYLMR